jgi:hypothetical protein
VSELVFFDVGVILGAAGRDRGYRTRCVQHQQHCNVLPKA